MGWLKTGEFKFSMVNRVTSIKWGQEATVGKWRDKMSVRKTYVVLDGKANQIIDMRIYDGSGQTVRCAVWINAGKGNLHTRGTGSACSYRYDNYSAAAGNALISAGIALENNIKGVGESAIRGALKAIAKKILGKGKLFAVVEAHN